MTMLMLNRVIIWSADKDDLKNIINKIETKMTA